MQVICDSAEDDSFDKYSVDSLDCDASGSKTNAPRGDEIPFRLHVRTWRKSDREVRPSDEGGEAMKLMWNCEIDESVLISKGLQLNGDGSFSRSPREEGNVDLPFVMPATKVALIRRKKQNSAKKSRDGTELKSKDERSLQNVSIKKLPTILTSLSSNYIPGDEVKVNNTDKRCGGKPGESVLPLLKKEIFRREKVGVKQRSEESVRAAKNRWSIQLPNMERSKLSYYERYQKKNGFDPETMNARKPLSDTVRSNFGDSARETLSEVSSGFLPVETDDDEEVFYRKVMAGEKVSPGECVRDRKSAKLTKSFDRSKEIKILKATWNKASDVRCKALPSSVRSGGSQHVCVRDPEPLTKADLASKARAYGNLANTRNIAKLQMRSRGKAKQGLAIERDKKEPLLPPLTGKTDDVTLPWETRSLLMQISNGRDTFNRNVSNLKNHINSLRMLYLPEKEV